MSKRRNLKKEKAQRNQAYARQFRKKLSQGSGSWGRKNRQQRRPPDDLNNSQDKEENLDNNNNFSAGNRFKP